MRLKLNTDNLHPIPDITAEPPDDPLDADEILAGLSR